MKCPRCSSPDCRLKPYLTPSGTLQLYRECVATRDGLTPATPKEYNQN